MDKKAEEMLKSKGITKDSRHHNYAYLYYSALQAMQEYADQEARKAFDGALKMKRGNANRIYSKYPTYEDYKRENGL
jgi:hypothetical protein